MRTRQTRVRDVLAVGNSSDVALESTIFLDDISTT